MSVSRLVWCSPEINRNRNLKNAKMLNDSSIQSLKIQIVLFVVIIAEICLNLLLKVFGGSQPSVYIYMLICKTFLAINIVFIISYVCQIMQARFRMYLDTRENKNESIMKSLIFEIFPHGRYYYEKIIKCKWLSYWLQKEAIEQERIQAKIDEERRRTLYKMYLPSLHSQNISYGDIPMKREIGLSTDMGYNGGYQDSMYKSLPGNGMNVSNNIFSGNLKPFNTSTPYSRRQAMSSFPNEMAMVPSPIQPMYMNGDVVAFNQGMRTSNCASPFEYIVGHYQPSSSPISSPHQNYNTSMPAIYDSHRNQSEIMTEVSSSDVWARLGIDSRNLDQWSMDLKQWLHGTIVSRVIQEIDKVNDAFIKCGITDVVIGEASVQTLRQMIAMQGQNFPSLAVLIDFLDCSKDQAYVVNRIRELSQGCSLGKFQWDCGSTSARHPWKEHLPNDTSLVLHLLSVYIDSRVHSTIAGHRTFSQLFIIDNLHNKDPAELKDACALLQTNVQPPHFKVIFNQMIYDISAGRKNMLECLLVFFYKVYRDEGNLKWLNLGRSGLNLNWIFDQGH